MGAQQIVNLVIPLGFLVVFYFLLIRPQQKRDKAIKSMRSSLKPGDEVVTIGGIVGKITKVTDDTVTIDGTEVDDSDKYKKTVDLNKGTNKFRKERNKNYPYPKERGK